MYSKPFLRFPRLKTIVRFTPKCKGIFCFEFKVICVLLLNHYLMVIHVFSVDDPGPALMSIQTSHVANLAAVCHNQIILKQKKHGI